MSVPTEVSELRVRVAELENDLWHMKSQMDAAVASTQALIQVVSNLAAPRGDVGVPPVPAEESNPKPTQTDIHTPQHNNEELEGKIAELQRQLAKSEKLRQNLQAMTRHLMAEKNDRVQEEQDFADDESRSRSPSNRRVKRNRIADNKSRSCSTCSDRSRGRSLVRPGSSLRLRDAEVIAQPIPAFAFGALPAPALPATAGPSSETNPVAQISEEEKKAAALEAEKKAAKKAESDRVMKEKLLKLKELKQSRLPNADIANKFGKTPLVRAPVASKGAKTTPVSAVSDIKNESGNTLTQESVSVKDFGSPSVQLKGELSDHLTKALPEAILSISVTADFVAPQDKQKETTFPRPSPAPYSRPIINYGEELNYSDDECSFEGGDSLNSVVTYRNPDEIDLDLSDDDSNDIPNHQGDLHPITPNEEFIDQSSGPMYQYGPLSDALKAIDSLPCEWENSDDEEEVVVVPAKPAPSKVAEDDEEVKAMREKIAKLLTSGEPEPTEPTVLLEFKVPEPGYVYKTGLDITRVQPLDEDNTTDQHNQPSTGNIPTGPTRAEKTISLYSVPNKQLFESSEKLNRATIIHRADDNENRYCHLFKYGLFYTPDAHDVENHNVLRTVLVGNLPKGTTLGDLTARIRGGMIVSANIVDTMKLLGSNSARVVFHEAESAARYVAFSMDHPIKFGPNTAEITLVGTPTYPTRTGTHLAIENQGYTRYLQVPGCPPGLIPMRHLILDISCKPDIQVPDGTRAESMEEPWIDNNDVLHLAFGTVSLAGSAYGVLRYGRGFRRLGLNPRFVEDPCDGDMEELLSPPPMERELQAREGKPRTELQKLQDSFRNHQKDAEKVITMPDMPSFGFQIPTVASATKAKHPSELEVAVKNGDAHSSPKKGGIMNSKYAPKGDGLEAKDEVESGKKMGRPLMITPDTYKKLAPTTHGYATSQITSPIVITGSKYDELVRSANNSSS